ncbi:hypothetical protein C4K18_4448 [Pseudomonas chlororaphis subsp. aurantiaca]|nr:hypothetical protein C4K18_4448 [Pseudomonas chlororaphis subsp. aurantiaca]
MRGLVLHVVGPVLVTLIGAAIRLKVEDHQYGDGNGIR